MVIFLVKILNCIVFRQWCLLVRKPLIENKNVLNNFKYPPLLVFIVHLSPMCQNAVNTLNHLKTCSKDLGSVLASKSPTLVFNRDNDCKKVSRQLFIFLSRRHQNTISPMCSTLSLLSSDEVTRAHPSRVVTPAPSQHQHRLLSVTRTTYFKQIGHPAQTIHCLAIY